MKIGIDARWIFPRITGIGKYTEELIRHLARVDNKNSYTLFFDREDVLKRTLENAGLENSDQFTPRLLTCSVFSIQNQLFLPALLKKMGLDIYHSTNYMIPFRAFGKKKPNRSVKGVTTLHDLIPLLFPDHAPHSKKARLYPLYKKIMLEVARRSDGILCPSEATRTDILNRLRIPENRREWVTVIPEGVSDHYYPSSHPPNRRKEILYVGRMDPYKNVPLLIDAFAEMRKRYPDARLTLIGPEDPRYPETSQRIRALNLSEHVLRRGYVEQKELTRAYQQADLLVLASRYEGFGLPVLEAMACGLPVIGGNVSSLPEVIGEAGLLVDPDNVGQLAEAMLRVLTEPRLAESLSERGLERAAQFTWEKTARLTLQAYQRILDRNSKL